MENIHKNPTLIIISGGSGTGKTSITTILAKNPQIIKLISTTTRPPRAGERNQKDYYFISKELFQEEVAKGKFLEHIIYDGNYYGIHGNAIDYILKKQSKHGVTILDVAGFRQVKKYCQAKGYPVISFWLQAPNEYKAMDNMRKRNASQEEIMKRLLIAQEESKSAEEYDYKLVINDNLAEMAEFIKSKLYENR